MNATRKQLEAQFSRVVADGWLRWFQREAKRAGTTTAHLLGIGSRETNLKNIKGDYRGGQYHGFGVMQVDIGTDPVYARNWTPQNVEPSIVRGTDIYLSKVRDTKNCVGKKVSVRNRSFVGRAVEPDDLRRIATASYNCGRWAHYHFSNHQNLDSTTTGHDYSRDVYDRSIEFAEMLEDGGYEQNAVRPELDLQGKYARQSHLDRFGYQIKPDRLTLPKAEPQEAQDELAATDYERDPLELSDPEIDDAVNQLSAADPISPATDVPSELSQPESKTDQTPPPNQNADAIVNISGDKSNVQDVNIPAKVPAPEPYNGIGFWATIKRDLAAVTGGNVSFSGLSEYAQQASGWPPWVVGIVTKIAVGVLVASVAYLIFRVIHYFVDSYKKSHKAKTDAMINSDPNRRDLEWTQ